MSRMRTGSALAAVLLISLSACSSKDDDSKAADDESTTTSSETPEDSTGSTDEPAGLTAEQTAACDALLQIPILNGQLGPNEPSKAMMKQFQELYTTVAAGTTGEAQAAATSVADTIDEALATGNKKLTDTDEFFMSMGVPAAAGRDVCGWEATDFKAHEKPGATKQDPPELHYMGIPEQMSAGLHSFGLANEGQNFHEVIIVKLKDEFTGSKDDFLALSDEEMFGQADGGPTVAYAAPGTTGILNAELAPGRYIFFCHIPLMDKKGEPIMGERGPQWHFTLGMAEEVTVS